MPIDNRKILQNILMPEMNGEPRRTLTAENADEIQAMFSQERLDSFVESGVLEGDWKASSGSKTSNKNESGGEPEAVAVKDLSKMTKAELVTEAGRLNVAVVPDSETNKQIIAKIEAARGE